MPATKTKTGDQGKEPRYEISPGQSIHKTRYKGDHKIDDSQN